MDSDRLPTDQILKKFSNPNLAAHAFLDVTLQNFNPLTQQAELHSQSSQLLSQLDHATEELTWKLEDLMNDLKKSGPRLTYQIELLRSSVSGLVTDIEEASSPKIQAIKKVREADTGEDGNTVARLQQLETVRQRMKQTEKLLKDAQSFDELTLGNNVAKLIEENNIEGALKEVEEAAVLIQIWKGTSIYQGRAKFVAQLRKRIEMALGQQDLLQQQQYQDSDGQDLSSNRRQLARTDTGSPSISRPGTPSGNSRRSQDTEGYYGLLGQLQRKIGY